MLINRISIELRLKLKFKEHLKIYFCCFFGLIFLLSDQKLSKNMNRSFDVSDFDADELNKEIDDTNFPRIMSNNVSNGPSSNGRKPDENGEAKASSSKEERGIDIPRRHLRPLKVRGISDEVFEFPGSPKTPRSGTTPGSLLNIIFTNTIIA